VKVRAIERGFLVAQPTKLKTGEFATWLRERNADVALVVAYGRILPQDVLDAPRLGCVNVHASLLPKYRGAAPIAWAIVRGERDTGITLMKMDAGMDTGDMLEQWSTPIDGEETAGALSERLSVLGARAVREGLPKYLAGRYAPKKQDDSEATVAPLLKKDDGVLRFDRAARAVHDHVRGMNPWPGATTTIGDKTLKIHSSRVCSVEKSGAAPGEVILADKSRVLVACGQGSIELVRVQLEGRKAMTAVEWFVGRGVKEGDRLGDVAGAVDASTRGPS
jgi:methionyl-tRNA formyltransferase